MGLSPELLERFKALATCQDGKLVKVDFEDGTSLYGFVRQVNDTDNWLVIQHVYREPLNLLEPNRPENVIALRSVQIRVELHVVRAFSEVTLLDLPGLPVIST